MPDIGSKGVPHKENLSAIEAANIKPCQLSFEPELVGVQGDFFVPDILIINIPPRNQDDDPKFHKKQLLTIQRLAKDNITRVLFISSTRVYPNTNGVVIESDTESGQLSRGGISLLEMEKLFMESSQFQTPVIRFGGLSGPGRHPGISG